jgi:hypothetical protein
MDKVVGNLIPKNPDWGWGMFQMVPFYVKRERQFILLAKIYINDVHYFSSTL